MSNIHLVLGSGVVMSLHVPGTDPINVSDFDGVVKAVEAQGFEVAEIKIDTNPEAEEAI